MMSVAKGRRVRVSKNRKKSWRKFSDIKDVEDFLEEQRHDERIGGCIADKPDNELFFSDTNKTPAKETRSQAKRIKNLQLHSSVCYSSIPPPIKINKVIGKKLKSKISKVEEKKLENALKSIQRLKTQNKEKITPYGTFHDLWDEGAETKVDPEIEELIAYNDEITKKKPVKVPNHLYQKPSLLPAVEVPHPGASYNPTFADHQDLLRQAVAVEEKKEKEEMHLKRILTDMFPVKSEAPTEETWVSEMSQGLFDEDDGGEVANNGSNCLTMNPAVTTETQKSKSKKKKEKLRKKQEREKKLEKGTKHEINKVYRLRGLLSEIKKAEQVSQARQQKKDQLRIEKMYQPRSISCYKYEPNDIEVSLSEELAGSLREIKVEGNILEDRYKSLQRRNIIEPRIRQKRKRKYKLKIQVKRSHRNFE